VAAEQVTSPDQHKPNNLKWWRIGGIGSIVALLSMLLPFNNHAGWGLGDVYLVLTAGLIAAFLIGDTLLRRRGLRR
jgi:hypothetical protein